MCRGSQPSVPSKITYHFHPRPQTRGPCVEAHNQLRLQPVHLHLHPPPQHQPQVSRSANTNKRMESNQSSNAMMGPSNASSSSSITPMSPGKQARLSELVNIITTTSQALKNEFDWVSPDMWTQILDDMFPATGGMTNLAGNSTSIAKLVKTIKTIEFQRGKSDKIHEHGYPSANVAAKDLTPEQRHAEWSLIIRYGDPRASMNDEQFAHLVIALKRWWRLSPRLEVIKMARNAVVAQFKLVGYYGPGMLPFNTAIWQKATHDAQCDFLRQIKQAGDARGVMALESFLGKRTRDEAVVLVRETKRDPPAANQITEVQMLGARETKSSPQNVVLTTDAQNLDARESRKRSKRDVDKTNEIEISDSDSDIPAVHKRQKIDRANKPTPQVVEIDSDDEPVHKKPTRLSLIVKLPPQAEKNSLIVKLPIKSARNIPTKPRISRAPPPQADKSKKQVSVPRTRKRAYIYHVEAELTASARTNAFIDHLLCRYAIMHRQRLSLSPWALEKVRRYAVGKEPHIRGPVQASMMEVSFWEGRDLSWTMSGFELDRMTKAREKAKIEWEARQVEPKARSVQDDAQRDGVTSGTIQVNNETTLQGPGHPGTNEGNSATMAEFQNGNVEAVGSQDEPGQGNVRVDTTDNQAHGSTNGVQKHNSDDEHASSTDGNSTNASDDGASQYSADESKHCSIDNAGHMGEEEHVGNSTTIDDVDMHDSSEAEHTPSHYSSSNSNPSDDGEEEESQLLSDEHERGSIASSERSYSDNDNIEDDADTQMQTTSTDATSQLELNHDYDHADLPMHDGNDETDLAQPNQQCLVQ
ncbi:hypothetical protein IWX49DRAFT_575462 [Phyllosticta citricarpa]